MGVQKFENTFNDKYVILYFKAFQGFTKISTNEETVSTYHILKITKTSSRLLVKTCPVQHLIHY